jgi:hypothetical protein
MCQRYKITLKYGKSQFFLIKYKETLNASRPGSYIRRGTCGTSSLHLELPETRAFSDANLATGSLADDILKLKTTEFSQFN